MNYAFRITTPYSTLPKFIKEISECSTMLVVYEHHNTKRKHIHGYVEGLTISTDTCKNRIKKELGVTVFPKSDWEFSQVISKGEKKGKPVDRESITYFHKAQYPIQFYSGITMEEINEYHSKSYKSPTEYTQEKVQYKLISESKAQSMKRQSDLIKEMKVEYKKRLEASMYKVISDEELIKIVNFVIDSNNIVCGMYKRMDYCDSLQSQLGRTTLHDDMLNAYARRKRL